jgi:hypothetical protein
VNQNGPVSLKLYDVTGRLVRTVLDNVPTDIGSHSIQLDMKRMASGVYMYVLTQGDRRATKFMTLLK